MDSRKNTMAPAHCIFAVLVIGVLLIPLSVAVAQYQTYDGPFFTVEYPKDWQFTGKTTDFRFFDTGNVHFIKITIGGNYSTIDIQNDYTTYINGSLDEPTMHFLNTLKFKSFLVSPNA